MSEKPDELEPRYSIAVYKDHAFIKGGLTSEVLLILVEMCKLEGFTHMQFHEGAFKLVKND